MTPTPIHLDREAAALAAIARGWPVFVLGRTKRPVRNCRACAIAGPDHNPRECGCLLCHGFYAATLDPQRIRAMLAAVPTGLLAIATGTVSGLLVVDVDPHNGGQLDPVLMTETYAVATGNDGWHLYYQHPGGYVPSRGLPGRPGVDIKADGGYVVSPPSRHPATGRPYRPVGDRAVGDRAVEEMRRPLLDAVQAESGTPAPVAPRVAPSRDSARISCPPALLAAHLAAVERAPEGRRRHVLYGAARGVARMVAAGALDHAEAVAVLTDAGHAAGQSRRDTAAAIAGGFRAEGVAA